MLEHKLDLAARDALEHSDPNAQVEVLVRIVGSMRTIQPELEQAGLEVHNTVGAVASGVTRVHKLLLLASLSSVQRIELGRVLFAEHGSTTPELQTAIRDRDAAIATLSAKIDKLQQTIARIRAYAEEGGDARWQMIRDALLALLGDAQ